MYLQNKYTRWYYSIVEKAKTRVVNGYIEKHHIIPKSLGGNDTIDNLVKLTAREHFICHWLLTKMVAEGSDRWKMMYALNSFNRVNKNQNRYIPTSRQYEIMKKMASDARSQLNKGNSFAKGHVRSPDTIEKWRKSREGYSHSNETRLRQSETMKEKYKKQHWTHTGKTYEEIYGEEEARKRKNKLKGTRGPRKNSPGPQSLITCPHCNKIGGISNMKRYHFDKCLFQYLDSDSHS